MKNSKDTREDLRNDVMFLAENLAKKVGDLLHQYFLEEKELSVSFKSRKDIVTELDVWAENEIRNGIAAVFPNHSFMGEESSSEQGLSSDDLGKIIDSEDVLWIVDPIDGTANFANRIPHYAVSLGICFKGVCEVGVIYDPSRKELFKATSNSGAFLNGRRIYSGKKLNMMDCVVATGLPGRWLDDQSCSGYLADEKKYESILRFLAKNSRCLRQLGAATLDFCWVACSRLDCCFEPSLKPWDVAAGVVIAKEAGAKLSHFMGEKNDTLSISSQSFVASATGIYDDILAIAH